MLTAEDLTAVSRSLDAFLQAREGARRFHASAIGKGVNPEHCLCDWLDRVRRRDNAGLAKHYPEILAKAALSTTSGTTGGYLVPVDLREELFETVDEESIIRPGARVVKIEGTKTLLLPLPDVATHQDAGIPAMLGGFTLAWVQEAQSRDEDRPNWRQVELNAWELAGACRASNTLLQDATRGFEPFLRRLFARAVAWYEDVAFLTGNGVGKPLGTRHAACALSRTRASANDFTFADAAAMIGLLLPSSWNHAIWAMHPTALVKLVALATTTTAVWQANQSRQPGDGGPVGYLHNLPVYVTERVPKLGTAGDVQLIDRSLYVIGDRQEVQIDLSADEPTAFVSNQSVFRITHRVDGQPWLAGAVRLQDGTNYASSFVYLN